MHHLCSTSECYCFKKADADLWCVANSDGDVYFILWIQPLDLYCFSFQEENRAENWKLTPSKFIEALIKLGANPVTLTSLPELKLAENSNATGELLQNEFAGAEEEFLDTPRIRKALHKRLFNIEALVKLTTIHLQQFPFSMTTEELKLLLVVVTHLTVDKLVQLILWDLKILIGSILDAYSDPQWLEEVEKYSKILFYTLRLNFYTPNAQAL